MKHGLFYQLKSGHGSSFQTDTGLIHLFDHIKLQTSEGLFTGMVMIDLQKAFNTVEHQIICQTLRYMGMKDVKWFESYLTRLRQLLNVNGTESELLNVTCGVSPRTHLRTITFPVLRQRHVFNLTSNSCYVPTTAP